MVATQLKTQSREAPSTADDPIALFHVWLEGAAASGLEEPTAMTVATVGPDGFPDARLLLLKGVDERGFVFFTNMESPKAQSLLRDPRTALCFYWMPLDKQVRVRGRAKVVSDEEADAYFATRPRLSQISAWASKQSQPMEGYFELEAEVAKAALRFGIGKIPRPPFWSGFRVVPERIEFWTGNHFAAITGSFTNARERAGESTGFTHSHKSPAQ